MKQLLPLIILLTLFNHALAEEIPKPFMGINHRLVKELPYVIGAPAAQGGIQVINVQTDTPADKAGLMTEDIIIGIDGSVFNIPPERIQKKFTELLYIHKPGETMDVKILRSQTNQKLLVDGKETDSKQYLKAPHRFIDSVPSGSTLIYTARKKWLIMDITITLGTRDEFKLPKLPEIEETDLGRMLIQKKDKTLVPWQPWVDKVINRYKLEDDYNDLRDRLRRIEAGDDGYRLPTMAAIHRNPFFLERYGRRFTDELIDGKTKQLQNLFTGSDIAVYVTGNLSEYGDLKCMPLPNIVYENKTSVPVSEKSFKEWFESQMGKLVVELDLVFASISAEDRIFIEEHIFELTEVLANGIYLQSDEDKYRFKRNKHILELGAKIDLDDLFQASYHIGRFLLNNEDRIFSWMKANHDVRSIETQWGKIGFGTEEHNRWDKPDFKFIFDPGGDDFYADGTGVANTFDRPISWIIDKKGDDAYQSTCEGAQGSGLPGVGILIDRNGDDTYIGSRWAQGTGFFGVGILIDNNGDDSYHGTEYVQGAGLFGMGVLADIKGDDRYYGTIHAQGVGFTHGLGLLIDYAGNDNGYCTGKHPTNYGDPGIFDAWSQGCGMGFRGVTSGGIGILVDVKGHDKWEAGNFSQGGGYYYGFGIFRAGSRGDDTYIASRYGQGFCAHQAAGLFIEDGGDDTYTTRQSVVSGLAWDQSVTIFIDEGGDDRYNGGTGFSLGASAHNGFCIFLDKGGRDEYIYKPGPARAGGNDYHGGSSFSFFIDLGKDKDVYTSDKVRNDVELVWREYGVFRDGKGEIVMPMERPE